MDSNLSEARSKVASHGWLLLPFILLSAIFKRLPGLEAFNTPSLDSLSPAGIMQTIILLLVIVQALFLILRNPDLLKNEKPLLFFYMFNLITLFWVNNDAWWDGIRWVGYVSILFGAYFIAKYYSQNETITEKIVIYLLFILIFYSLGNILYREYMPAGFDLTYGTDTRGDRLRGIAGSPNILAVTTVMLMSLCIGLLAVKENSSQIRRMATTGLLLGGLPLYMSHSHVGKAGLGLTLAVILMAKRRWAIVFYGGLAGLIVVMVSGDTYLAIWKYVNSGFDHEIVEGFATAALRIDLYFLAIQELFSWRHILLGLGAGTTMAWVKETARIEGLHGELLQMGLDLGLIGIILLFWFYWNLGKRCWFIYQRADRPLARSLGLAGLGVLAVSLPNLLWNFILNDFIGWLMFIILGLAIGAGSWGFNAPFIPQEAEVEDSSDTGSTSLASQTP